MELRHLRYFIAVAEESSISRAADRLNISQPPLSRQISDLEKELEIKLFDRLQKGLKLTTAGQIFFEKTKIILEQVENAVIAARNAYRKETGKLIYGYTSAMVHSSLTRINQAFRELFPNVELQPEELKSQELIQEVYEQRIDVCFVHLPPLDQKYTLTLKYFSMLQEGFVVVLPDTHPLAEMPNISLNTLAQENFILPSYSLYYQVGFDLCEKAGFQPKIRHKVALMNNILGLVAGGEGIAIVPAHAENIGHKDVICKRITENTPLLEMVALWRHDNTSPVLQNYLNIIQEIIDSSA